MTVGTTFPHTCDFNLSNLGFVHLLMFNASQAVNYFHKALGIRRDDTFSTAMLEQALELMLADLGMMMKFILKLTRRLTEI